MDIKTSFSCGDKGWVFDGAHVRQRTIGQIRVTFTHSPGIGDGLMEGGVSCYSGGNFGGVPDNYAPTQPETKEEYMCVETGIGSGSIYTLGQTIFVSEEECRAVCAEQIAQKAADDEAARIWRKEQAAQELERARRAVALLEAQSA